MAGVVAALALYVLIVAAGQNGSSTDSPSDTERLDAVGQPSLPITRRDALAAVVAGPYPNRGVMLGRRGLGGVGDWIVVDFDRLMIERFVIDLGHDGKLAISEDSRFVRSLSADEVILFIGETRAIRNSPPAPSGLPMVMPTDTQCDVVLLDEDDVRFGYGRACPAGTERLVLMLQSFGEPAPVQPRTNATPLLEKSREGRDR